jgi:hypothetical protein
MKATGSGPLPTKERYCGTCLVTGICSLAIPFSGVCVALLMTFVVPSRFLHNPLAELSRVYTGTALLLPVPLGIISLAFFITGIVALRRDPDKQGLAPALTGLALSMISVVLFTMAVIFAPAI